MAEVQLALQRGPAGFEKLVVVKLVHENLASQKAFVDMLLDEARVAALVKHPNVVDIYDLGEADGRYFIAMEYLEGEPLLAVLRAGRDGKRLDVLSTARLVADTAEGLDAAHELRSLAGDPIELVHHDVSLGNVVVLYNGQVKLVDFGVAKASQSAAARTRVQGKFGYMAPEKLRGDPGDRRSDIWSLGCVLWEALTLRRLFRGDNDAETRQQVFEIPILPPSLVNRDVPVDFDPIVLRMLQRDPARRARSAKAIAIELEDVLRKHGYAAKNDAIARYMQATFRDHIAARKKLLQEVSSKGRPSPGLIEAAFHGGAVVSGSPVPPPVLPASRSPGHDGPTERRPYRDLRRWMLAGSAAAALAVVVATRVLVGQGEDRSSELFAPAGTVAEPLSAVGELPQAAALPGTTAVVVAAEPIELLEPAQTEDAHTPAVASNAATTAGEPVSRPPRRRAAVPRTAVAARPVVERINPDELFKEGVQAFMRGDARTAIALCRRVTQSSPGFGPAWRLLGLVHERLGEKAGARAAFERYLQLSPGAGDAVDIRHRLDAL
jgi:serine/threonine-protein kinase